MMQRTSAISMVIHLILSGSAIAFAPGLSRGPGILVSGGGTPGRVESKLFAKKKKKGKKKGGGNKKQSGFEWAQTFTLKPFEAKATRDLVSVACASFEGRTGKPLFKELKESADLPKALWKGPVACLVVGTADEGEGDSGQMVVKYANVAALETVGLRHDEYERLISPSDQGGDAKQSDSESDIISVDLPAEMKGDKRYEGGYQKKILRGDGDEDDDITILNAQRWALEKSALIDGKFVTETIGVAYAWNEWSIGEDTLRQPGGVTKSLIKPEDVEGAIEKQGDLIRGLKETGLGNQDPEIKEAVAELLRLKDQFASLTN